MRLTRVAALSDEDVHATTHVEGGAITPSGSSGTVVSGALYVDDFMTNVPAYGQQGADETAAIPYTYTIGSTCAANQGLC